MHKDEEFYAIDAHSHLGRRETPLGHGVASFLGDDLVRIWTVMTNATSCVPLPKRFDASNDKGCDGFSSER